MKLNRNLAVAVACALLAPAPAVLAAAYTTEAPVIEVKPVINTVPSSRSECRMEPVTVQEERSRILRSGYVDYYTVPVTRHIERCHTINESRQVNAGYNVRYRYDGREYTAFMTQHPGSSVTINVDVTPPAG